MNPLNILNQSAILYGLKAELEHHQSNLQRALDGTSYFYIPTGGQREKIQTEQARLTSIQAGITALADLWHTTLDPRQHAKPLSASDYDWLRTASAVAIMQAKSCKLKNVHPVYTQTTLAGLNDLFVYVDCKLDSRVLPFTERVEYSTVGTDMGYTLSKDKFHAANR